MFFFVTISTFEDITIPVYVTILIVDGFFYFEMKKTDLIDDKRLYSKIINILSFWDGFNFGWLWFLSPMNPHHIFAL